MTQSFYFSLLLLFDYYHIYGFFFHSFSFELYKPIHIHFWESLDPLFPTDDRLFLSHMISQRPNPFILLISSSLLVNSHNISTIRIHNISFNVSIPLRNVYIHTHTHTPRLSYYRSCAFTGVVISWGGVHVSFRFVSFRVDSFFPGN